MSLFSINSTYGIIIVQDMKAVFADDNYAQIYGYHDAEELLTSIDSFLDLIPEDMHQLAESNYYKTISGKLAPHGQTYINIDRDGNEFAVFSLDRVIEWEGRPALEVVMVDMSGAMEAQKQLREKDRMYKQMIMDSGQGIIVQRHFKPLMVNQAWVDLFGADSIEQVLEVESLLEVIPEDQHRAMQDKYDSIISGQRKGENAVVENICFDGVHRFFNVYDNRVEWEGEPAMQIVFEDVTEKVKLEQALSYQASHDELTDLYNRRAVYQWINEHLGDDLHLTCMLMDIDDFKMINDHYGHLTGDEVIKVIADTAKTIIESVGGIVGRWGGEEFIAFIPSMDAERTHKLAKQICHEFYEYTFKHQGQEFDATVSIGISAMGSCSDQDMIDALIRNTDKFLYFAKADGKNRACIDKHSF